MKTAILHPWFLGAGGGEQVAKVVAGMFPDADLFTLYLDRSSVESLAGRRIQASFLNRFPFAARLHYQYLPLYPWAVECLDLRGYDLLLSMCGPVLMGANAPEGALHLAYCHTPPRPWWDLYAENQRRNNFVTQAVFLATMSYIRLWEFSAVQRIDALASNSRYIGRRVAQYYRRDSEVIYPPVNTQAGYLAPHTSDYYLTVGRLAKQKRVEILIEACNQLKRRLVIVGTGREEARLKALAGPTIEFAGFVEEEELHRLYAECRAFLFAANEDFGIAPVEAQSFGRPVIAYGHGGSLETVRVGDADGQPDTGVFFAEQSAESLSEAILRFESNEAAFQPDRIQQHARQFDTIHFQQGFRQFVQDSVERFKQDRGSSNRLSPRDAWTSTAEGLTRP